MKFFGPHRPERVLLRRNTLYGGLATSTADFRRCQSEMHTLFLAKLDQLSLPLFKILVAMIISAAI